MRYSTILFIVSFIALGGIIIPFTSGMWIAYALGLVAGFLLDWAYTPTFINQVTTLGWTKKFGGETDIEKSESLKVRTQSANNAFKGSLAGLVIMTFFGILGVSDLETFLANFAAGGVLTLFLTFAVIARRLEKH